MFHSSRLARGSGKKNEGRSLTEVHTYLRRHAVQLRSVEDDTFLTHPMLVSLASEISHKYSQDLSSHTKRGKRDAAEAGRWPGGPVPDGYRRDEYIGEDGRAKHRLVLDEEDRAPLVRRIFQMAAAGHSTHAIARRLNREGIRTLPTQRHPDGYVWGRNRINKLLTNPMYCGRLVIRRGYPDERPPVQGVWPALVTPELFDSLNVPARRYGAGRPPTRSKLALYKLAHCAKCGGPMYAHVSQFERKDGTRQRYYECAHRFNGVCEAPRVDAGVVDTGVIAHINRLFIDMEAWQAELAKGADQHRERVEKELKDARAKLSKVQQREDKVKELWLAALNGDDPKAEMREEIYVQLRQQRIAAEGSVKAVEERLALVPSEPPTDEVLDLYSELARVVREGDAEDLNERLRLVFSEFVIETIKDGILVMPLLRDDVVERFADPSGNLRVITNEDDVTYMRAPDGIPPNAGLLVVTGDETIRRRPPANPLHIGTDVHASVST